MAHRQTVGHFQQQKTQTPAACLRLFAIWNFILSDRLKRILKGTLKINNGFNPKKLARKHRSHLLSKDLSFRDLQMSVFEKILGKRT